MENLNWLCTGRRAQYPKRKHRFSSNEQATSPRQLLSSREGRNLNIILAISSEKHLGGRFHHRSAKGRDSDRRSRARVVSPSRWAAQYSWFGVQTKVRHEKQVAAELEEKGVTTFLPLSANSISGATVSDGSKFQCSACTFSFGSEQRRILA